MRGGTQRRVVASLTVRNVEGKLHLEGRGTLWKTVGRNAGDNLHFDGLGTLWKTAGRNTGGNAWGNAGSNAGGNAGGNSHFEGRGTF